jgi:Uncharacterized protein conserved in bacteria
MKLDVAALTRKEPAAVADLLRLCQQCARVGAAKVGAQSFTNDIVQDMMLLVLERFLPAYDGEREVEPFLIEAARRMGLGYQRRHGREILLPEREDGGDPLHQVADDVAATADVAAIEEETNRRAAEARAALIARMRERQSAASGGRANAAKPAAVKTRKPSKTARRRMRGDDPRLLLRQARANRPAVQRLRAIRRKLGLTQEQMAIALGLTPNAIRSLEYGLVDGRPDLLLKKAQGLLRAHGANFDGTASIQDCMQRWCRMLKVPEHDMLALGQHIGVHRSTLFRWRTGRTHPPPHIIREIHTLVEALSEHA